MVVEVHVPALPHHRDPRTGYRKLNELEVPRRGNPALRAHPPEFLAEKVAWRVVGEGEFVQPAYVHRGLLRLQSQPRGFLETEEPHANTGDMSMNTR
jgi:hypothetical protein